MIITSNRFVLSFVLFFNSIEEAVTASLKFKDTAILMVSALFRVCSWENNKRLKY